MLRPFFTLKTLNWNWKFKVYKQTIQSIVAYSMESLALEQHHIAKLDAFHFRILRCITGQKSSFYHKIIADTGLECTNSSLHDTLINRQYYVPLLSTNISQRRLVLLGHLFRHPEDLEHKTCFGAGFRLRTLAPTLRHGAPRLHWTELVLTDLCNKLSCFAAGYCPKLHDVFTHPFFATPSRQDVYSCLGSFTPMFDTTSAIRYIRSTVEDRDTYSRLVKLPKSFSTRSAAHSYE